MSLYVLHHMLGLAELGYEVHYLERAAGADACYDPRTDRSGDDPTYAVRYLERLLAAHGFPPGRISFIDRAMTCHGSGWPALHAAIARARFVLTLCDTTWIDELGRVPRRLFVDGDPLFTQVAMLEPGSSKAEALARYDTLFTYATRIGAADCPVPHASRRWLPARPVVTTALWPELPPPAPRAALTALLHWGAGKAL